MAGALETVYATHLDVINAGVMINPGKNKPDPTSYKLSLGAHSQELVYQTQPGERSADC